MNTNPGRDAETTLYVRLAEALAEAKGVDVLDLDPIYDEIDAEAVAHLLTSVDDPDADCPAVTFLLADYEVTVTGVESIDVTPETAAVADD